MLIVAEQHNECSSVTFCVCHCVLTCRSARSLFRRCWVTTTVWQPCWSTKLLHCVGTPRVVHRCTTPHPEATRRFWPVWCRLPWQQTHKINCWTTTNTPHYTGLLTKVWTLEQPIPAPASSHCICRLKRSVFGFRAWRLFGGFTWI